MTEKADNPLKDMFPPKPEPIKPPVPTKSEPAKSVSVIKDNKIEPPATGQSVLKTKVEEPKKPETPLETVQRIIREHDGIVSNIPVNHSEFWEAKSKL